MDVINRSVRSPLPFLVIGTGLGGSFPTVDSIQFPCDYSAQACHAFRSWPTTITPTV